MEGLKDSIPSAGIDGRANPPKRARSGDLLRKSFNMRRSSRRTVELQKLQAQEGQVDYVNSSTAVLGSSDVPGGQIAVNSPSLAEISVRESSFGSDLLSDLQSLANTPVLGSARSSIPQSSTSDEHNASVSTEGTSTGKYSGGRNDLLSDQKQGIDTPEEVASPTNFLDDYSIEDEVRVDGNPFREHVEELVSFLVNMEYETEEASQEPDFLSRIMNDVRTCKASFLKIKGELRGLHVVERNDWIPVLKAIQGRILEIRDRVRELTSPTEGTKEPETLRSRHGSVPIVPVDVKTQQVGLEDVVRSMMMSIKSAVETAEMDLRSTPQQMDFVLESIDLSKATIAQLPPASAEIWERQCSDYRQKVLRRKAALERKARLSPRIVIEDRLDSYARRRNGSRSYSTKREGSISSHRGGKENEQPQTSVEVNLQEERVSQSNETLSESWVNANPGDKTVIPFLDDDVEVVHIVEESDTSDEDSCEYQTSEDGRSVRQESYLSSAQFATISRPSDFGSTRGGASSDGELHSVSCDEVDEGDPVIEVASSVFSYGDSEMNESMPHIPVTTHHIPNSSPTSAVDAIKSSPARLHLAKRKEAIMVQKEKDKDAWQKMTINMNNLGGGHTTPKSMMETNPSLPTEARSRFEAEAPAQPTTKAGNTTIERFTAKHETGRKQANATSNDALIRHQNDKFKPVLAPPSVKGATQSSSRVAFSRVDGNSKTEIESKHLERGKSQKNSAAINAERKSLGNKPRGPSDDPRSECSETLDTACFSLQSSGSLTELSNSIRKIPPLEGVTELHKRALETIGHWNTSVNAQESKDYYDRLTDLNERARAQVRSLKLLIRGISKEDQSHWLVEVQKLQRQLASQREFLSKLEKSGSRVIQERITERETSAKMIQKRRLESSIQLAEQIIAKVRRLEAYWMPTDYESAIAGLRVCRESYRALREQIRQLDPLMRVEVIPLARKAQEVISRLGEKVNSVEPAQKKQGPDPVEDQKIPGEEKPSNTSGSLVRRLDCVQDKIETRSQSQPPELLHAQLREIERGLQHFLHQPDDSESGGQDVDQRKGKYRDALQNVRNLLSALEQDRQQIQIREKPLEEDDEEFIPQEDDESINVVEYDIDSYVESDSTRRKGQRMATSMSISPLADSALQFDQSAEEVKTIDNSRLYWKSKDPQDSGEVMELRKEKRDRSRSVTNVRSSQSNLMEAMSFRSRSNFLSSSFTEHGARPIRRTGSASGEFRRVELSTENAVEELRLASNAFMANLGASSSKAKRKESKDSSQGSEWLEDLDNSDKQYNKRDSFPVRALKSPPLGELRRDLGESPDSLDYILNGGIEKIQSSGMSSPKEIPSGVAALPIPAANHTWVGSYAHKELLQSERSRSNKAGKEPQNLLTVGNRSATTVEREWEAFEGRNLSMPPLRFGNSSIASAYQSERQLMEEEFLEAIPDREIGIEHFGEEKPDSNMAIDALTTPSMQLEENHSKDVSLPSPMASPTLEHGVEQNGEERGVESTQEETQISLEKSGGETAKYSQKELDEKVASKATSEETSAQGFSMRFRKRLMRLVCCFGKE